MPSIRKLDPTGERAAATEAMETTPISGNEHEYRADGDHYPRQQATAVDGSKTEATGQAASRHDAAPNAEVQTAHHISQGIPGAGESPETDVAPDGERNRSPRA